MDDRQQVFDELAAILELPHQGDGWSPEELRQLCGMVKQLKEENTLINLALDHAVDSFHVTDGKGIIRRVNHAFERRSRMTRGEVEGHHVEEMQRLGLYRPSMTSVAIREKRELTFIQDGPGGETVVTMTPVLDQQGEVQLVVSNGRFLDDLVLLDKYFREKKERTATARQDVQFRDPDMAKLWELMVHVAKTDSSILLTGETGTGKSFFARQIHEHSQRKDGRFVAINCAAIPENLIESELFGYTGGAFTGAKRQGKKGLIEQAHGGTLFLDEIGDMPLNLQAKLLQVLQNRTITPIGGEQEIPADFRLITATNAHLEEKMASGAFRWELFYRINVVPLTIPPLRERREDLTILIEMFLQKFCEKYQTPVILCEDALYRMLKYPWPGNIRELENIIERLVVTNRKGVVELEDLPNTILLTTAPAQDAISVNRIMPLKEAIEQVEERLILDAFEKYGSSYKVADVLQISQSSASRKYIKYSGQK